MADADDYTPRSIGDTANPLHVTFTDTKGVVYSLASVAPTDIRLSLQDLSKGDVIEGAGTWTIVDDVGGVAEYAWADSDVARDGIFNIIVRVPFAGKPLTFVKPLEIQYQPS